ncbi:magnesium transporter MgtE N-terminal domain-containing protein, partial [Salmonella sp. SAL4360]|uniref:magnesium transporter MgtE N-terminal domain-containing protein n=1 Tax=Salmonella sp. SAL4360 TaxID=3159881 RepID=UPI0039782C78
NMPVEASDSLQAEHRLDQLSQALNSGMFVHVRQMLQNMAPSDIALILESSPPKARQVLWQLVDQDQLGDILDELSEELKD